MTDPDDADRPLTDDEIAARNVLDRTEYVLDIDCDAPTIRFVLGGRCDHLDRTVENILDGLHGDRLVAHVAVAARFAVTSAGRSAQDEARAWTFTVTVTFHSDRLGICAVGHLTDDTVLRTGDCSRVNDDPELRHRELKRAA
ncbi:MAG: hypothetical protein AAGD18_18645 [Actinomycetota bacterium]